MLRLTLLGPPAVTRDGRPLAFDTRKATALLAFLALEGKPQPRDRLPAPPLPGAAPSRGRPATRPPRGPALAGRRSESGALGAATHGVSDRGAGGRRIGHRAGARGARRR